MKFMDSEIFWKQKELIEKMMKKKNSQSLMKELVNLMNISQYEKLKYGYRELTKQNYEKNLIGHLKFIEI